jgi:group I intron endonuclease
VYKGISGIYKITSPSGKVYIGQSYDIHNRYIRYKKLSCKAQVKLYESLRKYGFENHTFEVLQQAPKEELNQLEKNYVWRYNSMDRKVGLNLKEGGYNGNLSEETKDKIRQKAIGRTASLETRDKMSKVREGKPLPITHKANLTKVNQERCGIKTSLVIGGILMNFVSISEAKRFKKNNKRKPSSELPK